MRVEASDAEQPEAGDQQVGQAVGEGFHGGSSRGQFAQVHQRRCHVGIDGQLIEEGAGVHAPRLLRLALRPRVLDHPSSLVGRSLCRELVVGRSEPVVEQPAESASVGQQHPGP